MIENIAYVAVFGLIWPRRRADRALGHFTQLAANGTGISHVRHPWLPYSAAHDAKKKIFPRWPKADVTLRERRHIGKEDVELDR